MTSRSKNSSRNYETEIEKCREESNWKKAIELAHQLKNRSPQHESLAQFLIGEGKLEAHLEDFPPSKDNITIAQSELNEARGYLSLATDEAGKKAGVALDAHLLLGKLSYACGMYEDALKNFKQAELNTLTEKELPIRSLRIVAESYAIKGLCLELMEEGGLSRYKQAERDAEMTRSFELGGSLTLLYMQRAGAAAGAAGATGATGAGAGAGAAARGAGAVLEAAVLRAPLCHLRAGRVHKAIERYREMLSAVESQWTQALRLTLARQLAELLLRGVAGESYTPPQSSSMTSYQGSLTRKMDDGGGPWKPKKYTGINQFVPRSVHEEAVLALAVGEALAVRDAVLSQSAEFSVARAASLHHAVALADLLTPLAARFRHLHLLLESLERAMKFSFQCAHVWRQRALATAAAAADQHADSADRAQAQAQAQAVLRRARSLSPGDAPLRLVGAQTCYSMADLEEGVKLSEEALSIEQQNNGDMLARAHLYTGIGYQMMAQRTNSLMEKEATRSRSSEHLTLAVRLDPTDHLPHYHLALLHLHRGASGAAMEEGLQCLRLRGEFAEGLRLVTALWSALPPAAMVPRSPSAPRAPRASLALPSLARAQYPRAAWPLAACAAAHLALDGHEAALATARELLSLLTAAELERDGDTAGADLDALSDSQPDGEAASLRASSAGVYRVERALSEAAESTSPSPRGSVLAPRRDRRAQAWLLVAELCLRVGRTNAAAGCVAEAAALTPYSHLVLYTRGLVHAARREWEAARECFRSAVALHPTHLDSLLQLGTAYYESGWASLAESVLRAAAALQPSRADTWRRLALVLAARGEPAAAADAAAAALALMPSAAHPAPPATPAHPAHSAR